MPDTFIAIVGWCPEGYWHRGDRCTNVYGLRDVVQAMDFVDCPPMKPRTELIRSHREVVRVLFDHWEWLLLKRGFDAAIVRQMKRDGRG